MKLPKEEKSRPPKIITETHLWIKKNADEASKTLYKQVAKMTEIQYNTNEVAQIQCHSLFIIGKKYNNIVLFSKDLQLQYYKKITTTLSFEKGTPVNFSQKILIPTFFYETMTKGSNNFKVATSKIKKTLSISLKKGYNNSYPF